MLCWPIRQCVRIVRELEVLDIFAWMPERGSPDQAFSPELKDYLSRQGHQPGAYSRKFIRVAHARHVRERSAGNFLSLGLRVRMGYFLTFTRLRRMDAENWRWRQRSHSRRCTTQSLDNRFA